MTLEDSVMEIDFLQTQFVQKIEECNKEFLDGRTFLERLCNRYWKTEDGVESLSLFRMIVDEFHYILLEDE